MAEENLIKRIQPQSTEAEQTVIGSMILDNECIPNMQNVISGRDFYNKQYGVIFDAISELYNEGKAVDILTLQNRLKEKDVSPELSSMEYMGELIASVPISANAKYYAEIVYEKALLRRLIHASEDVANECYAGKDKLDKILEDAESGIFKVLNERKTTEFVPISEVTMNALEKINEASKTKNPVTGLATGFVDLDRMLTGLHGSDYVLIAARPSMGKTALALNIVQNVVFRDGKTAAIFSLEMSKEVLMNRLFAQESRIDAQNIRTGNLSDEDWDKLMESADTIARSNLIIDDTPGISVSELRSKCRKFKLEHGLDLVIIDYLQLMSGSGRGGENRQQEISEISRGIKALARELDAPIICLSQLSRAPEARNDKRPMMSDLRESGAIEQDADVVMFLYRDEYYNKDTEAKGITELIVGKQRNGPIGTVQLTWLPQYVKFANLNKERRE
ncbi:MAG: replicative DNA helicase [Lachnospiraceae bacterium]|nr:replicative DNA helicase [Lachnospiraceae bacterium]MBR4165790.1 replicative DNA helicase [Lachnospiraceae bacterium]